MNRNILILICLFFPSLLLSQEIHRDYFNAKWLPCKPPEAVYYRQFEKDKKGYIVAEYTIGDKKLMSGHVHSLKKQSPSQRTGLFIWFDSNGNKIKEGQFRNGLRTGSWVYYFSGTDTISSEATYKKGSLVYLKEYERRYKKVVAECWYKNGQSADQKEYTYYNTGALKEEEAYSMGGLIKKGAVTLVEKQQHFKNCFSEDGRKQECPIEAPRPGDTTFSEILPALPGGEAAYFTSNCVYKGTAKGVVLVKFVVNEDGSLIEIELLRSVAPEADEEALRLVAAMPKWNPGLQNGKPVKVRYTLPVRFK